MIYRQWKLGFKTSGSVGERTILDFAGMKIYRSTVFDYMKKFNIERRGFSHRERKEIILNNISRIHDGCWMMKKRKEKLSEKHRGRKIMEWKMKAKENV